MNILIVGGAGYVGGGIVDNLKNKHNVTVYDSLIYEESYRKDVNFIYGDIREHEKLLPLFDQNDAVIWLAALVGDGLPAGPGAPAPKPLPPVPALPAAKSP